MTRGCTKLTIGGPLGICSGLRHSPGPVPGEGCTMPGWPVTSTRAVGISHLIVRQGCGLGPGIVNGQPVTSIWLDNVATGWLHRRDLRWEAVRALHDGAGVEEEAGHVQICLR
jgi:hypothetical protein